MKEIELIARLVRDLPQNSATVVGPGDDCAVIDLGIPGQHALFKTDAVVEGVHYLPETPPEKVGHKALARCLSDIAAMAGTPVCALVTLGLPRDYPESWPSQVYHGMSALARRYGVAIVGGETTTTPGGTLLSIALLGRVPTGRKALRSGAQPGDAIFVTGELGGSLRGRHLEFEPRLEEAGWLADRFPLHAMIDLSDGLATDLRHILDASQCGAELLASAIPISRAARKPPASNGTSPKPPLVAALTDGEDFELLFTLPSREAVTLLDAWRERFPTTRLSCVGRIEPARGLRLKHAGRVEEFGAKGYEHFA